MIETERLILRPWRESDRAPFRAMTASVAVMEYFGGGQSAEQSDAAIARYEKSQAEHGHCIWAIERKADGAFIGLCGLKLGDEDRPIAGKIEIGWRLAEHFWRQGYGLEAARAALDWGFANLPATRIYAITATANERSWRLMERLGMRRAETLDFEHRDFADGHWLRPHSTYVAERGS